MEVLVQSWLSRFTTGEGGEERADSGGIWRCGVGSVPFFRLSPNMVNEEEVGKEKSEGEEEEVEELSFLVKEIHRRMWDEREDELSPAFFFC